MEGVALCAEERSDSPDSPPRPGAASNRRPAGFACKPVVAAAAGLMLLAVGVTCLVLPFVVTLPSSASAPATAVPARAPPGPQPPADNDTLLNPAQAGDRQECGAHATDSEQYAVVAAQAEQAAFGNSTGGGSGAGTAVLLDTQPRLRLQLLFWVLHSAGHPNSPLFAAAAATQVALLNVAFGSRSGIQFLLAALVPVAVQDAVLEGCASTDPSSPGYVINQLVSSAGSLINIVLCEPEGVHGTTAVLGASGGSSSGKETGAVEETRILLQRAALWHSRTSLVHQMGHFLGLAHPYYDHGSKKSCGIDADAIPDTPRQYLPNSGCSLDGSMHVCEGEDGPLPVHNFMDLTNDTCRVMFTTGQMLRMHAMTLQFRQPLYQAGVQGYPQVPLPLLRAYQSGLPPLAVILAQQQLAVTAGVAGNSSSRGSSAVGGGSTATASSFAHSSGQAWLAASAAGMELSLEAYQCSCLGMNAQNRTFWVGELGGAYWVDALRVLWRLPPAAAADSGGASCGRSAGADGAEGPLCDELPTVLVDVRVGYSPEHLQNSRCTPGLAALSSPLQQVECQTSLQGRFVSLEVAAGDSTAAGAPCLCAVQPLSYLANPRPLLDAPAAAVPGALLEPGEWWQANQSSTTLSAAYPLQQQLPPSSVQLAGSAPPPKCSATTAELQPWWALEMGLDALAVRGLRLSLPATCTAASPSPGDQLASCSTVDTTCTQVDTTSSIAGDSSSNSSSGSGSSWNSSCPTPQLVNLTILVGASTEDLLASRDALGPGGRVDSIKGSLCAANITVLPGQLMDVDCGRLIYGTSILISAQFSTPAPLELCRVEVLGAQELALAAALPAQQQGAVVQPPSLQPYVGLPIDGDESTCLQAPSHASSWALPLEGPHRVLGLRASGSGGNASAALLDNGGALVWTSQLEWPVAGGRQQAVHVEVGTAPPAAWLVLSNFSSLCELRLYSSFPNATISYALHPSPSTRISSMGSSSVNGTLGSGDSSTSRRAEQGSGGSWAAVSSSGRDAGLVADGSYRTCFGTEQGELPWVLLRFGADCRIAAVTLVSDLLQPNLTLHLLPARATASFVSSLGLQGQVDSMAAPAPAPALGQASTNPLPLAAALQLAGALQCAAGLRLEPWVSRRVRCQPAGPIVEALVVTARGGTTGRTPPRLRLCEVGMTGCVASPVL